MRIHNKIIISILAVSLLVLVVGLLSIVTFEQVLEESIGKESITVAAELSDEVNRVVHNRIEEWLLFSENPRMKQLLIESNSEFALIEDPQSLITDRDVKWIHNENPEFKSSLLTNEISKELLSRISFFEKRYSIPIVAEVFATNSFGTVIGLSQETSDYRQDDEQWWIIARNQGLYIEDVEFDESANTHTIDVSIRIDDSDSNFLGVMKVSFSLQELEELLRSSGELQAYHRDKTFIVSKDGIVLFSSDPSGFLQDISNTEFFQSLDTSQGFIRTKNSDGEPILRSYFKSKGYKEFDGFNWVVVVEHLESDILEPFEKVKKQIIYLSLFITILAFIIGFTISRSLTSPLKKLIAVINDISLGNMEAQIDSKLKNSRDEIGDLANSFDRILTSLKLAMENTSKQDTEDVKDKKERV